MGFSYSSQGCHFWIHYVPLKNKQLIVGHVIEFSSATEKAEINAIL